MRLTPALLALAALPLQAQVLLPEVEVRAGEGGAGGGRPFLRNEIQPVESCTVEEFSRSGAVNVPEAIDKRPGVAVQVECAICNARFISLNNLPGRYTTLLIDGVPLFSAVSQAYGLDSLGLRGLERIDLMRGAGASGLVAEALAGSVNLVTRRPQGDEALLEAAVGSHGHRRADVQMGKAWQGGALSANAHYNGHKSVDGDGNGISEYAGYQRELGGLGLFGDDWGGFSVRGRIDSINERRGGGALGRDYDAIKAARSGNPFNFAQGAHASTQAGGWIHPLSGALVPYADGRAGLSEIIFTHRQSAYLTGERRFGEALLTLAAGYARHEQDSFYEGNVYLAGQNQGYLMASLKTPFAGGVWTAQADWRYEDLRSRARLPAGTPVDGLDNYTYRTPGLGLQAVYAALGDRLEVAANLRADAHNVYGTQWSPRLNLLWHHDTATRSRLSAGSGYRAPNSYFEQDHGILETVNIVRATDGVERSRNLMYSYEWQDGPWKLLANAHWTRLAHLAYLDVGSSVSYLRSTRENVRVRGGDVQLGYQVSSALAVSAALELVRYDFPVGALAFARPEQRAYFTLDWDSGRWDVFARATWTGSQDLARFYYRAGQRYNLDGSAKPDRSPAFWVFDVRAQYALDHRWSVFAGVDNLGDFKQSDHDSPLWVGSDGRLDVTQLWGPNRGRFLYAGARLSF